MTVKLGTVEFYQAMADTLNNDPVWAEKGKNLNYDMAYKYEAPVEGQFFVTFEGGKVTEVRHASPADLDRADLGISVSSEQWSGGCHGFVRPPVAIARGTTRGRR